MNVSADKILVNRLIKGDARAFDDFFRDYFARLFRFAHTRLHGDEDAAEDVVQAALCKAVGKLNTYRAEAPLFTWLCTFCRHEISAYLKKQNSVMGVSALRDDDEEVQAALASLAMMMSEEPELNYNRHELIRMIQVSLDYLPAIYGDVLEWKYIQGLSVKDIAQRLQRTQKAAESILTRARVAFRDAFVSLTGAGATYE